MAVRPKSERWNALPTHLVMPLALPCPGPPPHPQQLQPYVGLVHVRMQCSRLCGMMARLWSREHCPARVQNRLSCALSWGLLACRAVRPAPSFLLPFRVCLVLWLGSWHDCWTSKLSRRAASAQLERRRESEEPLFGQVQGSAAVLAILHQSASVCRAVVAVYGSGLCTSMGVALAV